MIEEYKIGEIIFAEDDIEINQGKDAIELIVSNLGDRPIQVGSHYHFFECNFALKFDREKTFGLHLDIPSGTAVRFEPGEDKRIRLVSYSGAQKIMGFNGLTMGFAADKTTREAALRRMHEKCERERAK
ncbi:MAG: urease subunit beta [Clostridiales Family XIII bacterium]|jgi:urease beta subunit|nr:urease subunit beta [Clostridiales Family XIII bacterium]